MAVLEETSTSSSRASSSSRRAAAARCSPASETSDEEKRQVAKTPSSDEETKDEEEGFKYNPGERRKAELKLRQHAWQFWRWKEPPPPPPLSMDDAKVTPMANANIFSQLAFQWATPIMVLGWRRALEATDLNKLPSQRESDHMSALLLEEWDRQSAEVAEFNRKLESGESRISLARKARWAINIGLKKATGRKLEAGATLAEREAIWRRPPPPGALAPPVPKKKGPNKGKSAPPAPPRPPNYSGHKRASVAWALHKQLKWLVWSSVAVKALGDISQVTSPLVVKQIIKFGQERYAAAHMPAAAYEQAFGGSPPPLGHGIGYAFLLFFMQWFASIFTHQFFYRAMSVGVYSRSALIAAIFKRATKMSAKDRSPGKLLNHASTDVSRIDFASAWSFMIFTTPIQLGICLGLLIGQIGPSALAGFALLIISFPFQGFIMKIMFAARGGSMVFTDQRSKLINELLGGMRIVKSFGFEVNFLKRLDFIRRKELQGIRKILTLRSFVNAVSFSLPTLAAVIAFLIYSALGHDLNPANIFTALTLFQLLRMPLMFLPLSLSAGTDAYNAFLRLQGVFEAPQMKDTSELDPDAADAVQIVDATFQWFEVTKSDTMGGKKSDGAETPRLKGRKRMLMRKKAEASKIDAADQAKAEQAAGSAGDQSEATANLAQVGPKITDAGAPAAAAEQEPFALRHLDLSIARSQLCAVVGPVGSGKSSLLAACLGEMPQKEGRIIWGTKSIGYVPQQAWIQAASLRDNILFGRTFEQERYWRCIRLAELEGDLAALPQGDLTGIGERGITLSGGQKQRVSIARALYLDPDIYLFDDILSALDAHVGKSIFQNAILGLKARGKTVLLVTHALHHLHDVDRIITMEDGQIAESGTYKELKGREDGAFARLMEEFGGTAEEEDEEKKEEEEGGIEDAKHDDKEDAKRKKEAGSGIMTQEQRNTGSVSGKVYKDYIRAGRGSFMLPLIIITICIVQVITVLNSYWLVWWQEEYFGVGRQGLYMGVYAGLGVAQAVFLFFSGFFTSMLSFWACANLHNDAMTGIIFAKMSFFDTTPVGRIMNVLTKDIDVADNQIADAFRMALNTIGQVLGSIILITVLTHYFVVAVAVVCIGYYFGALFYRSSARELKRLDAILRSSLYAHFSESLTGLTVIRAYNEVQTFTRENMKRNDEENRAYFMTIINQRWLGVRLDLLGAILTFVVALLVVCADTISPGNVGVALSYVVTTTQSFSWMTRQIAEVENDMNSIERLTYYTKSLDQEAEQEVPNKVGPSWPERGEIDISNMALRYRTGLPLVLHDVNLKVHAGEKVGIVGRTGAGKSSLLTGLLRLVELERGSVHIDGVDISKMGLAELRRKVAVLPQDPLIFSGTLRSNLDPFGEYDDARLNDALKRAYLIDADAEETPPRPATPASGLDEKAGDDKAGDDKAVAATRQQRFSLDTPVEEEGANLSLGQRSLVSLARALVKDSQIILLDEATASVDVKTDARIQETIRTEFASRTLLCIAHRLRTIISYDRIAVFDAGRVVEFASPLSLFDRPDGIFRDMCLKASITREEMVAAVRT
ncbi:hypothetical protein BDZ90DRAFT_232770 [Jaminaea rosea]|uniref:Uncharacterized protein n=1 Tax=Jaminaea rosea TaxID=1569628 RepID=A0A316UPK6_9BASI|nr:hypothetical protein BDZ90DRAFT_232770 [Jaminaea rosea]PWN27227.1 hypothetical protein BDZ90DRAFT_232770 [Jaminaea rosea]